jgi:hypothetical protein
MQESCIEALGEAETIIKKPTYKLKNNLKYIDALLQKMKLRI